MKRIVEEAGSIASSRRHRVIHHTTAPLLHNPSLAGRPGVVIEAKQRLRSWPNSTGHQIPGRALEEVRNLRLLLSTFITQFINRRKDNQRAQPR